MDEKEFNLLEEPWIRVLAADLSEREESLINVLIHAQDYRALAGEMATQDIAILRLLLACVQTIFYRYNADGEEEEIEESWYAEDVLERWREYWEKGALPENAVREYFDPYRERFWLFHPETPFYQVPELKYGTDFKAQGLYGNMKSSNNVKTKYHFSQSEGREMESIPFSEAARWLVHLNAFCVNIKNNKQAAGTQNPAGVGRLGRLGLIYADGSSLFETLLLNLTPLRPNDEPWAAPAPVWEYPVRTEQSIEIASPDNLPELYTMQSRRIRLYRDGKRVTGLRVMNGDYCIYEDAFFEPMTIWRKSEDKKTHVISFLPKSFRPGIQVWREFSTIFNAGTSGNTHTPGIVHWINFLNNWGELPVEHALLTFRTVGMAYGDGMSYTYGDCLSDGITLSAELLKSFSEEWMARISDEIEKCVQTADAALAVFAKRIGTILNDDGKTRTAVLKERFYAEVDVPFRDWLAAIRPDQEKKEDVMNWWEATARRCAQKIVTEYVDSLQQDMFKIRETDKGAILSVPGSYEACLQTIWKIYPEVKGAGDEEAREQEAAR